MSVVTRQSTGPANVPFRRLMSNVSRIVPSKTTYLFPVNELNAPGRGASRLNRSGSVAGGFCWSLGAGVTPLALCAAVCPAATSCASAWRTSASKSVVAGTCTVFCAKALLTPCDPTSCSASCGFRYVKATFGANKERYSRFFLSSLTGSGGRGGCAPAPPPTSPPGCGFVFHRAAQLRTALSLFVGHRILLDGFQDVALRAARSKFSFLLPSAK